MRTPQEQARLRLLPEHVLDQERPRAIAFGEAMAQVYGVAPDTLVEVAVLGLWYAWETFDPDRKPRTKWSTWLRRCMGWFVSDELRDWGRSTTQGAREFHETFQIVSLQDPVAAGDDGTLTYEEVAGPEPADVVHRLDTGALATEILSLMLPRERYIYVARHFAGDSKEKIAAILGIGCSRVSQIENTAKARILFHFAKQARERDNRPQAIEWAENAMRAAVDAGMILEIAYWLADLELDDPGDIPREGPQKPEKGQLPPLATDEPPSLQFSRQLTLEMAF